MEDAEFEQAHVAVEERAEVLLVVAQVVVCAALSVSYFEASSVPFVEAM